MQENPWTHMSGPFVEISKSKSESQTSIMADPDVQRSYSSMCAHAEVLSHFNFLPYVRSCARKPSSSRVGYV